MSTARKPGTARDEGIRRYEYRLLTPSGKELLGTLERLHGRCNYVHVTKNADGTLEIEHGGETDVFWDAQETVRRRGQRVWIDEDADEWLESELKLVPVGAAEKSRP